MRRRAFLRDSALALAAAPLSGRVSAAATRPPNFIVILCDDPYSHDIKPLSLYEGNAPGVELAREDVDFPQLQQRFYDVQSAEPEQYSVAARHPDVLADMQRRMERAQQVFAPLKSKELPDLWRSIRGGQG